MHWRYTYLYWKRLLSASYWRYKIDTLFEEKQPSKKDSFQAAFERERTKEAESQRELVHLRQVLQELQSEYAELFNGASLQSENTSTESSRNSDTLQDRHYLVLKTNWRLVSGKLISVEVSIQYTNSGYGKYVGIHLFSGEPSSAYYNGWIDLGHGTSLAQNMARLYYKRGLNRA
ncbi:MAG: hypothetical protein JNN18_08005 [Rubrivivax sp.]|nr:hypothetical protein [Rubrivivax sp.]